MHVFPYNHDYFGGPRQEQRDDRHVIGKYQVSLTWCCCQHCVVSLYRLDRFALPYRIASLYPTGSLRSALPDRDAVTAAGRYHSTGRSVPPRTDPEVVTQGTP
jgi:hypothetical protein